MTDPFPGWKAGDQFCMYCGKIVKFPHQCPKLVDAKGNPTHEWVQCLDPSHQKKHKVDGRSESNRYVKCIKCTWHIPMEYVEKEQIYPCPAQSPTPFTETTAMSRGMTCPKCKTPLKSVAIAPGQSRWYCPQCNPLSNGDKDAESE